MHSSRMRTASCRRCYRVSVTEMPLNRDRPPPAWTETPLPPCEQTNMSKNITFPQLGGNNATIMFSIKVLSQFKFLRRPLVYDNLHLDMFF